MAEARVRGVARLSIALALVAAAAGCSVRGEPAPAPEPRTESAPADPRHDPGFHVAASRGGTFTVAWRALGGRLPRNESVQLEVFLYEGGAPLAGAGLTLTGFMPDHGHGMVVQPEAVETEPGRYVVSGVLLHMRGRWQLAFDVVRDGYSERADFELEVR